MCHSHHHPNQQHLGATRDSSGLRASDRERDQTATTLQSAAAEGRLTVSELEERLQSAWTARTRGQLAGLTSDLGVAIAHPHRATRWVRYPTLFWALPLAIWLLSSVAWHTLGL